MCLLDFIRSSLAARKLRNERKFVERLFQCFLASQFSLHDDSYFSLGRDLRLIVGGVGFTVIDRGNHSVLYSLSKYSAEVVGEKRRWMIKVFEHARQLLETNSKWSGTRVQIVALCVSVNYETVKVDLFIRDNIKVGKQIKVLAEKFAPYVKCAIAQAS